MSEWRTCQFFLTPLGVYEVETDSEGHYRCSCGRGNCKHTKFVARKADDNGGQYPVRVSTRATDAEIQRAHRNPRKFRDLLVKYARVEVM
jgi:hypothetical protein